MRNSLLSKHYQKCALWVRTVCFHYCPIIGAVKIMFNFLKGQSHKYSDWLVGVPQYQLLLCALYQVGLNAEHVRNS